MNALLRPYSKTQRPSRAKIPEYDDRPRRSHIAPQRLPNIRARRSECPNRQMFFSLLPANLPTILSPPTPAERSK